MRNEERDGHPLLMSNDGPGAEPDIHLTIRARNNCLRARRLKAGLTPREIGEKSGVGYETYLRLEGLKASPIARLRVCKIPHCSRPICPASWLCKDHSGLKELADEYSPKLGWSSAAEKLAKFHNCTPVDLWPDAVLSIVNPVVEIEIDGEKLKRLTKGILSPGPDHEIEARENKHELITAIKSLTPRQEEVLVERFIENKTLKQAGEALEISASRVREIEGKALRKLRERLQKEASRPTHKIELPYCKKCLHHRVVHLGTLCRICDPGTKKSSVEGAR